MQQTEKYKLNLIERDDAFSPDALNQNTQKVENALAAHEAAVEEVTDAIDQRVTVLEGFKFAWGGFNLGTEADAVVELDFTPSVVFVFTPINGRYHGAITIRGLDQEVDDLHIMENSFRMMKSGSMFRPSSGRYDYIAFGANQ